MASKRTVFLPPICSKDVGKIQNVFILIIKNWQWKQKGKTNKGDSEKIFILTTSVKPFVEVHITYQIKITYTPLVETF